MKGVSSVLVKVKPCRKGAQHQSKTQHLENSSKANTKLQSWAGRVALWAAAQRTGQQKAACACWRSLGHSQAPTLVTYLTPLVKPCKTHNQWHPLPRHSHTHTRSQRLTSLCWQLQLWSETVPFAAARRLRVRAHRSSGAPGAGDPAQNLLVLPPRAALKTAAKSPNPPPLPSWCQTKPPPPKTLLCPAKDVVKQNS